MKKEYMKPEAELVKFVEAEEIMADKNAELGIADFNFASMGQTTAL